jgi:hypothetical protein
MSNMQRFYNQITSADCTKNQKIKTLAKLKEFKLDEIGKVKSLFVWISW